MRSTVTTEEQLSPAKFLAEIKSDTDASASLNDCELAIDYLNSLNGSRFRRTTPESIRLLSKIYSRGFTLADVMAVIQHKVEEWRNVPEMKGYLCPKTLFDFANFKRYHAEVSRSQNLRP